MIVLVANLGSTSFKFKLIDTSSNAELARGGYERIGQQGAEYADHAEVLDVILKELPKQPEAIGFKAVHGGPISGAVIVDENVLATMEQFVDFAPAHNPPYIAAMKAFAKKMPGVPQVAAFETAFHATIPLSRQVYAVPYEWVEKFGIRRYGFHGASHRYIATRMGEIAPEVKKIISCHLGGSSSITAINDGKSVATSMGLTPQTGLPQNNRVGDFDTFALPRLLKEGMAPEAILKALGKESGLLGLSGVSNDMRDIEFQAAGGNERAQLAIDAYVESIRGYIGNYLVALGGADAIVFTAGIGENGAVLREMICANLDFASIALDTEKNKVRGKETKISRDDSRCQVWVVPTNEELIVAKQTAEVLATADFARPSPPPSSAGAGDGGRAQTLDYQSARSDDLVVAATFSETVEANLALGLLQANDIDAQLGGENTASLYSGALGSVALLVPAGQLAAAKAVLPTRAGGTNTELSTSESE